MIFAASTTAYGWLMLAGVFVSLALWSRVRAGVVHGERRGGCGALAGGVGGVPVQRAGAGRDSAAAREKAFARSTLSSLPHGLRPVPLRARVSSRHAANPRTDFRLST